MPKSKQNTKKYMVQISNPVYRVVVRAKNKKEAEDLAMRSYVGECNDEPKFLTMEIL